MLENDEITRIQLALKEQGVTQKSLADHLGLPPSAVSNLLKGKRSLKVEEARKIGSLLKLNNIKGMGGKPISVINFDDVAHFDSAVRESARTFDFYYVDEGSRKYAVVGYEPRLTVERFRRFYFIVDPDDRSLFTNGAYLIREDNKSPRLVNFKSDPARFEPFWDPTWDDGAVAIEAGPFLILGAVREIGWRPEIDDYVLN